MRQPDSPPEDFGRTQRQSLIVGVGICSGTTKRALLPGRQGTASPYDLGIAFFLAPAADGTEIAIRNATALGSQRISLSDLPFAVRQLVEVAVRALSPGINDPQTAISVLNRLGAALCEIEPLHLPTGVFIERSRPVLTVPHIGYESLLNTMFHMIRQNAAQQPAVLIKQLEVLTQVARVERQWIRLDGLRRHAHLVFEDAQRTIDDASDLADVRCLSTAAAR